MKTATVRQIQHHFNEILQWLGWGEEVQVTKRNRIVAKIIPILPLSHRPQWPNFVARAKAAWGKKTKGKSGRAIISALRKERF